MFTVIEETEFVQCPQCDTGISIHSEYNHFRHSDKRQELPFCSNWCLISYLEDLDTNDSHEDINFWREDG